MREKEIETELERHKAVFGERSPFGDKVKMPRRSEDKKSESLADRLNKNFLEEEERRESRGFKPGTRNG
jgi:hypothetical protein